LKRVRSWASVLLLVYVSVGVHAQDVTPNTDVLGLHNLSSGANPMSGSNANACSYCHTPHRSVASNTPLWNQTLSTSNYTFYNSPTAQNAATQPVLGATSLLCLSCHDGTVAVGQTVAHGQLKMSTNTFSGVLGTKLDTSHPFSLQLPIKDAANLVSTLAASGTTKDSAVKLVKGNIECNTCHEVHNQYIDRKSPEFLVRDNSSGKLCLACHEVAPRTVNGHSNSLSTWTGSIHATSTVQVAPKAGLGGYTTVAEFACANCHAQHNANGPGLLAKSNLGIANVDSTSQPCLTCHNGSDNLATPTLNILADFQKTTAHPFADDNNVHAVGEPLVLDRNRHATCADCHNSHATTPTVSFNIAPGLRPSQSGVGGVATDGSALSPATNQYENCLRCHGASAGKQSLPKFGYMPARALFTGDVLNVALEFGLTATSSHPVMRDATNIAQPSLLSYMWDQTGKIQKRAMGSRIFCSDCHSSDTNREFGGSGANGPHGSKNDHILERTYLTSTVNPGIFPAAGPGSLITNLIPNPPLDPVSSPFALCAKCHDLTNVMSNVSFTSHANHVSKGISCSVCHTAHGVPGGTTGGVGRRLVNFDLNVVAPYNNSLSYNPDGTCTLTCHMTDHNGSTITAH
jgi:hypothetical protein